MKRRATPFRQADITRLINGARAAGVGVEQMTGIKLTEEGATLLLGDRKADPAREENEWDEVLGK